MPRKSENIYIHIHTNCVKFKEARKYPKFLSLCLCNIKKIRQIANQAYPTELQLDCMEKHTYKNVKPILRS